MKKLQNIKNAKFMFHSIHYYFVSSKFLRRPKILCIFSSPEPKLTGELIG